MVMIMRTVIVVFIDEGNTNPRRLSPEGLRLDALSQ